MSYHGNGPLGMQARGGPGQGGGGRKHRHEDEEMGKLFVGGLSWDTTQETLLRYFGRFGECIDCVVMKNSETGRSRGFGFVTFADPNNIDVVLASGPHTLDGRTIDPKACNPRSMQKPKKSASSLNYPKVFLGGLPSNVTETELRTYYALPVPDPGRAQVRPRRVHDLTGKCPSLIEQSSLVLLCNCNKHNSRSLGERLREAGQPLD